MPGTPEELDRGRAPAAAARRRAAAHGLQGARVARRDRPDQEPLGARAGAAGDPRRRAQRARDRVERAAARSYRELLGWEPPAGLTLGAAAQAIAEEAAPPVGGVGVRALDAVPGLLELEDRVGGIVDPRRRRAPAGDGLAVGLAQDAEQPALGRRRGGRAPSRSASSRASAPCGRCRTSASVPPQTPQGTPWRMMLLASALLITARQRSHRTNTGDCPVIRAPVALRWARVARLQPASRSPSPSRTAAAPSAARPCAQVCTRAEDKCKPSAENATVHQSGRSAVDRPRAPVPPVYGATRALSSRSAARSTVARALWARSWSRTFAGELVVGVAQALDDLAGGHRVVAGPRLVAAQRRDAVEHRRAVRACVRS